MAFERLCLDAVKHEVSTKHGLKIDPWFEYGTMWCDRIDEDVADTVARAIVDFCKDGTTVGKTVMKPTKLEPWYQWAFDII